MFKVLCVGLGLLVFKINISFRFWCLRLKFMYKVLSLSLRIT